MARYLKGSCNNTWDRDQDRHDQRAVPSYFGSMSDDRLRAYLVIARGQLAMRRDVCMASNLREAQEELARRGLTEQVA